MNQSSTPSITPQLAISALAWIVTQLVAFGLLDAGTAQTLVSAGGIVIPAVFALAVSLHLGKVHAAQIVAVAAPVAVPVVPVAPAPVVTPKP